MADTPIDRSVLAELEEATGADFLAELIQTFLEEAPGMFDDLTRAAAAGDTDGFRRAAHSIKSNANTFGATALGAGARALEMSGIPDRVDEAIAALRSDYASAARALKEVADG